MHKHQFFANLRKVLANLYLDKASSQRIAKDAGLQPIYIDTGGKPINDWDAILTEADNQNRVGELLECVLTEYPTNKTLEEAYYIYLDCAPAWQAEQLEQSRALISPSSEDTKPDPEWKDIPPQRLPTRPFYPFADAPNLSADLGMIWGLARHPFIGVMIGAKPGQVLDCLAGAEGELRAALHEKSGSALPTRIWFPLQLTPSAVSPRNIDELLPCLGEGRGSPSRGIKADAGNPNRIIGFVIELSPGEFERSTEAVANLCKNLMELFENNRPAVVLHLSGTTKERWLNQFKGSLKGLPSGLQPEIRIQAKEDIAADIQISSTPRSFLNLAPTGECFAAWLRFVADHTDIDPVRRKSEFLRFPLVITQFNTPPVAYLQQTAQLGTMDELVTDLFDLAPSDPHNFHLQFLSFTDTFLPQVMPVLLQAYACADRSSSSASESMTKGFGEPTDSAYTNVSVLDPQLSRQHAGARAAALAFACRSDEYMDAWLSGFAWEYGHLPESRELISLGQVSGEPAVNCLVLGLLRCHNRHDHAEEVAIALLPEAAGGRQDSYYRLLSPDLQSVVSLSLGLEPEYEATHFSDSPLEAEFLRTADMRRLMYAVRAEYKFTWPQESLVNMDLEKPFFFWILLIEKVDRNLLTRLLSLSQSQRAVLGLCTKTEWEQLSKNSYQHAVVLKCRARRPISY